MSAAKKQQSLGAWFSLAAILLTVVGAVLYWSNANSSYYHDFGITVPVLSILCILLELALILLARFVGESRWLDLLYPIIGILLAVTAVTFLSARAESAGTILGSNLEAGNVTAYHALYQAFGGMGCYLAAMICNGVAGFLGQTKT